MATSNANCNYFMQGDAVVLNMVLRIFLRVIAQSLQAHSPGAVNVDKTALHIGAVTTTLAPASMSMCILATA